MMLCSPNVPPLVHLQHAVDFIYKPEAGEEAYSTCKNEENEHHDQGVAKVEDGACSPYDL